MKKAVVFILVAIISSSLWAQEKNERSKEKKLYSIVKVKLGFSELKVDDYNTFNGYISGGELMLSSKLTNKLRLEYGLGLSKFTANNFYDSKLVNITNDYYHLPVNLMYNKEMNTNASLIMGLGLYGTYLAKSDLGGLYKGNNVGGSIGCNLQIGANIRFSEDTSFRIMYEAPSDISKIENSFYKLKQSNTNLLSLSFVYKL